MVFKQFADVVLVEGKTTHAIYDLSRQRYELVNSEEFSLLQSIQNKSIEEVEKKYGLTTSSSALKKFLQKEWVFLCEEEFAACFPKLDYNTQSPTLLSNVQVFLEFIDKSNFSILHDLEVLGAKNVQIWHNKAWSIDLLRVKLEILSTSSFGYFELVLNWQDEESANMLNDLALDYPQLQSIHLLEAPKQTSFRSKSGNLVLLLHKTGFDDALRAKVGGPKYFNVNHRLFSEAQQHNIYFNGKVAIDSEGNVRNALSSKRIFGNVFSEPMVPIIQSKDFQRVWKISKNEIQECNSCVFRYMCIDEREPVVSDGTWCFETSCPHFKD